MPGLVKSDDQISMVVKVRNADQTINNSVNGVFHISAVNASLENSLIKIKRGVGSTTTNIFASDTIVVSINSLTGQKTVLVQNDIPISRQNGEIYQNTVWIKDSIYRIDEDITILPTAKLTIESGVRIYVEEKVNFIIQGSIQINGSLQAPVVFQPVNIEKPWGGLRFINSSDSSTINYSFFTYGGNNEEYIYGHSNSQPIIFADHSVLNINNSFIIDNPGKAVGGLASSFKINNCVFSRCDTGGEYDDCSLNMSKTYFIDMPSDDGIPIDDDNDAIYVYGVYPFASNSSVIDDCTFITGKDDGIDHNGSILEVRNSWIEGFYHEGIAASNTNSLTVYNTLIKNCDQGIEAGYYSPQVLIDHCVMINNNVGLRFGDSYDWGCSGHITAINSIMYGNEDNILNYDLLTQGPIPDAIAISYSMTNDIDYNANTGCITGTPLFDSNYFLQPNSPGIGMAADGGNLGLINSLFGISEHTDRNDLLLKISPNPFYDNVNLLFSLAKNEKNLQIKVFNSVGTLQYTQKLPFLNKGNHSTTLQLENYSKGLYIIGLYQNNSIVAIQKVVKF
jgi:hypothetical protein